MATQKQQYPLRLDHTLMEQVRGHAKTNYRTIASVITEALVLYFQAQATHNRERGA
jgi:hypothetical protein